MFEVTRHTYPWSVFAQKVQLYSTLWKSEVYRRNKSDQNCAAWLAQLRSSQEFYHHLFWKRPLYHAKLWLDVCPKSSLHISLKITDSECIPSSLMSGLRCSAFLCTSLKYWRFSLVIHEFKLLQVIADSIRLNLSILRLFWDCSLFFGGIVGWSYQMFLTVYVWKFLTVFWFK